MTDFATPADIIAGITASGTVGFNQEIYKASITTASGFDYSGWTQTGAPTAGAAPTTWAHPTQATAGAINPKYINPTGGATARILWANLIYSVANQPIIVEDRIGHMASLSGTNTGAQTVSATLTTPAADGRCATDGSDVQWWLEWYTATGSTAVNATVAVTYSDNSTGNVVVALPASVPAFRMYPIRSASANLTIKGITSVTLSASTGSAGNFGVTCTNRKFGFSLPVANQMFTADWATLGMPSLGSNSCLFFHYWATSTAAGIPQGTIKAGAK